MMEGTTFGKYLGFPFFNAKTNKRDYQFILENFKNRLAGWKTTHLTIADRTTLIKATLNPIPNHLMQIMSLPTNIIQRLESYEKYFLWGSTSRKKKLHLINWETVTSPKEQRGLGIQKLC